MQIGVAFGAKGSLRVAVVSVLWPGLNPVVVVTVAIVARGVCVGGGERVRRRVRVGSAVAWLVGWSMGERSGSEGS